MTRRRLFRDKVRDAPAAGFSATDEEMLKAAYRRADKLATTDLLNWADMAGSGMAKGFQDYREHGDITSLEEIGLGIITLHAVALVLKARAAAE